MNSWLRNIQGQLTELATEVLQEATEEVEDPETELQVERRKCAEAERMLIVEKSKSDQLEKRIAELENQLYTASLENDASKEKFENMIATRDIQIEHLQQAIQSNRLQSTTSISSFQNIDLEERTLASKKSNDFSGSVHNAENRKISQELSELKEKHEAEISALMTVNMENVNHIRDEYEQRIRELQNWGVADVSISDDDKAIAHEKEINELKSALELVHEENQRTIAELKAQLLEKENELHKIHETGFTSTVDTVFDVDKHDDSEKRPSSVDGTDSAGSNNGWERMGNEYNTLTEFKSHEERVASTSVDLHNQLKQSLDEANLQIAQLSEQCAYLTAQSDTYVSEKQDMEQQLSEMHEEKHQLVKQLNESVERCAVLEKEVSSLRSDSSDILKQEEPKIEELFAEKEELARLLSDAKVVNESTLQKLEHLTSELSNKDEKMEALNEEFKTSRNELFKSREELEHLKEELCNKSKMLEALTEELTTSRDELFKSREKLVIQLNKSEEKCAILEKEVFSLRSGSDCVLKQEESKIEELFAEKEELARLLSDAKVVNESTLQKLEHLTSELSNKDEKMEALNEEFKTSRNELFKSREELEHLKEELCNKSKMLEALTEELTTSRDELFKSREKLVIQLNKSEEKCAILEKEVFSLRSGSDCVLKQEESKIEELFAEKEELARLLSDAKMINESTLQKLEHLTSELSNKDEKMEALNEEFKTSRNELFKSREELEHLNKELERLREHLMSMEEISTREAIIAEERETQLRNEIRALQERSSNISENVSQSHNQYQCEISTLRDQLVASEENSAKLRALLEEREKSFAEVSTALANLQQVLGELGEDQKQEIAAFEKQMEELKKENKALRNGLAELQRRELQLVEDRRYFEDSLTLLKEQDERKTQVIEDLENHIEELTHKQRKESMASRRGAGSVTGDEGDEAVTVTDSGGRPMSTYKIDDVTLKQLFYSYLMADKEKQPEIALVMASILGYSQEEHSSIQEAVSKNSSGGGWLGFGWGRRALFGSGAPSLTDQFIRFLEAESRSLNEQPKLHIPSDHPSPGERHSGLSTDITPLSTTENTSSSDAMTARSAYSTSDLQSILES